MPSAAATAVDNSRGARLEARISPTQKSVLQRAAALSGRTLSEFVVASAQEAASKDLLCRAFTQRNFGWFDVKSVWYSRYSDRLVDLSRCGFDDHFTGGKRADDFGKCGD